MARLGTADLRGILSFLEEAHTVEGPAAFTRALLDRFAEVVRCEEASFWEADVPRRIVRNAVMSSNGTWMAVPNAHWTCERTVGLYRSMRVSWPEPVLLSDVFGRRLRSRPDFNPNRDWGYVDEIHLDLDPARRWKAHFAIFSSDDFGDRERLILQAVRSHLAALYRSARLRRRLAAATAAFDRAPMAELTPREREVMLCVADGLSNEKIANVLVVEQSTVGKHLEHVYEKLGVRSRTAALAKLRGDPSHHQSAHTRARGPAAPLQARRQGEASSSSR